MDILRDTLRDREALRLALAVSDAFLLANAQLIDYDDDAVEDDFDKGAFMVLRALPGFDGIEKRHNDFVDDLKHQAPDLARAHSYGELCGERDSLHERASFLLGIAIGARLGRDLIERAAFPRRNGGAV